MEEDEGRKVKENLGVDESVFLCQNSLYEWSE